MVHSIQKVVGAMSPGTVAFVIGAISATWTWLKSNTPPLQHVPVADPVTE